MKALLLQLAQQGDIDWLSYYFARFISEQAEVDIDDWIALSAALVSEANKNGDVCIDLRVLQHKPLFYSSHINAQTIPKAPGCDEWVTQLQTSSVVADTNHPAPLTLDGYRLYLHRYWHYENEVAKNITTRLGGRETGDLIVREQAIAAIFDEPSAQPPDDQQKAVLCAAQRHFSVISGGPGTGKTTTVVKILATLLKLDPDLRIALAAPTGKAAARMMESIRTRIDQIDIGQQSRAGFPLQASTIHRLLGYRQRNFTYNRRHQLAYDCVIIDEASMIDLGLMYHLLEALPDSARLILLGDRDQLSSVSAGNIMGDITGHGRSLDQASNNLAASIALLRHSYRFDADSGIATLAQQVNQGNVDNALEQLQRASETIQWQQSDQEQLAPQALEWILAAYQGLFETESVAEALHHFDRTRILCATNWGALGVNTLNTLISDEILKHNKKPSSELFHGLPVMVGRNHHELGIFNGDTGILWQTARGMRACFHDSTGKIREIRLNRLNDFGPAWVTTVHKSQGSEFDSVLLVLPPDADSEILSRELLYTAITRARHRFVLHGDDRVLRRMITRLTTRHSGLAERLGWSTLDSDGSNFRA